MTLPLNLSLFTHVLNSKTVTGDLNDLTTSGFYYVQIPTNSPTNTWVHAIVNSSDDKRHVIQLVLSDNGGDGAYYRDRTNGSWSSWSKLVTMDQVTNKLIHVNDQSILSKWYGMLSCQADGNYNNYMIAPTGITIEQHLTGDFTFYFKFVLPSKPDSIADINPRPLGLGTTASNLNKSIQGLASQVPGIHVDPSMIEPELIIDNPSGGNLIYSARSRANGTFTDQDQYMYIAPNTDQLSPAPKVHWGDTVFMTLISHTVRYNPSQYGGIVS